MSENAIVIKKNTLVVIGLIALAVVVFIFADEIKGFISDKTDIQDNKVESISPESESVGESFDRDAAIEELSEEAYYDCYEEIMKLNPTRTSSEDLEYFREVCKIQQKDYALSLEEYEDWFLEYLLSPEGRKSLREIREESK